MRVVLIADSDPDVRRMLELLFDGWHVVGAGTGAGALHAAARAVANGGLHLVVMALWLPDMSGEALYHGLRDVTAQRVPAIVLSGDAEGEARAGRMGAPFLAKPMGVDALLALAEQLTREAARAAA